MIAGLLSACATLPTNIPAQNQKIPFATREQQAKQITNWTTEGAIGVQTPGGKSGSASFNWQQRGKDYTLYLFGPLGMGKVEITGNPQKVSLRRDNQTFAATNPELLLQQQLGWSVPVADLYYWIRGIPAPNIPAQKSFDTYNHLKTLQQKGWSIHYQRYTSIGDIDLPSKLVLTRDSLKITLIISKWQIS